MADHSTFIKSATAETPVAKTRTDIMTLLERYGGTGFGYEAIGDEIAPSTYSGHCPQEKSDEVLTH